MTILGVLISYWKNWPFWRGNFGSKRHALKAVAVVEAAVVEKLKQESIHGLSAGTKKKWPL